ncbi:hypothetical protein MKI84_08420 [Ancylobacter sp. A5.8]|uniref:hypothetical protein n=1 Tax=Ancylobacter gelatini TaxID=2919920 RepID=UPI001F4DAE3F|nr:hypothetical protein [Ancylobacter gelatini]MCJ8142939.1 hypothetical protein [Ancylobacter gelatini]
MTAHPFGAGAAIPAELRRLVGVVDVILASLPAVDHSRRDSHAEHRKAAVAALDDLARTEGARWRDKGSELSVTLGGIRASSTRGAAAALQNWRTAVAQKIGGVG